MEKHIYFVRHGESETNVDNVIRGAGTKLTELGRAQAARVAERIEHLKVDAIVASPFVRAQETARAISERMGLPVEINELFREWLEPSILHGTNHEDSATAAVMKIIHDSTDDEFRHSDEETFTELRARGMQALAFLAEHPAERIAVVTHAGQMHVLFGAIVFGERMARWQARDMLKRLRLTNTGITYVKYFDDYKSRGPTWHVITWNDQAHMG